MKYLSTLSDPAPKYFSMVNINCFQYQPESLKYLELLAILKATLVKNVYFRSAGD